MTTINVNVDQMINPHFDRALYSNALNKVFEGGRGSTKSSVISLQLLMEFLSDPQGNALIMRKVANNIELSVYEQIKWAIYELHVQDLFTFKKSPYRITHKATGTAFYFSGVDDPQKLKSMIIARGYVRWLWFEEPNSIAGMRSTPFAHHSRVKGYRRASMWLRITRTIRLRTHTIGLTSGTTSEWDCQAGILITRPI